MNSVATTGHCMGQSTTIIESSHKYFVGLGVNRDRTGYLSVTPKVHDAASPALHISTLQLENTRHLCYVTSHITHLFETLHDINLTLS